MPFISSYIQITPGDIVPNAIFEIENFSDTIRVVSVGTGGNNRVVLQYQRAVGTDPAPYNLPFVDVVYALNYVGWKVYFSGFNGGDEYIAPIDPNGNWNQYP